VFDDGLLARHGVIGAARVLGDAARAVLTRAGGG